jgi:hypothetical protein
MANRNSMITLFVRLGAAQATAEHIVDEEGFDEMAKLAQMTTKDVDRFCKNIRSPGGLLAAGGQNRGHTLTNSFQDHLHQAVFFIKTKRRVSRAIAAGDIEVTRINTRLLNLRREQEAEYTNPTQVKVEINKQDWSKTFSTFEQALGTIKGVDGAPLSYCMRKDEAVKPEAEDPITNWTDDSNSEMKARAPIVNAGPNATGFSDTFTMDNPTVWSQVRFTFENTEERTHVRPFMRKEDGRGAILKLRTIKMGTQYVQNQSGSIEKKFRELTWKGDTRGWKFETYATKHQHYFNLLKELEGYQEPNEGTRVRMLMDGITSDKLDSCKNNILSSATLREDFDGAVAQFTNFLGAMTSSSAETRAEQRRNVSELGSAGGTKIQNRFYTPDEYKKMSKEDRTVLYELRQKADGGGKNSSGRATGKRTGYDKSFKEQNKLLKKQGRQIAKLMSQQSAAASPEAEDSPTDDAEAETEVASNRTNPALRRRGGSRTGRTEA